jgi:hypothetical protein
MLKVARYHSGLERYERAHWVDLWSLIFSTSHAGSRYAALFHGPGFLANGAVNLSFKPKLVVKTTDFLSSYNTAHSAER